MNYKFITYQSIYDDSLVFHALEKDATTKKLDDVMFIEVTPDFERVQYIRLDSLKPIGQTIRNY